MKRRRIHLDRHTRGGKESLHLRRVEHTVFDLILLCEQKYKIIGPDVDLAVAVIFQAVQLRVMAPAHAELDRHSAVGAVAVSYPSRTFPYGLNAGSYTDINSIFPPFVRVYRIL